MPDSVLSGHPMDHGWLPHKPDTWPYRYAKLREARVMRHYTGRWDGNHPVMREVPCESGQKVRIVMVSRFGDIGITENLDAENGYGARVNLEDLYDFEN